MKPRIYILAILFCLIAFGCEEDFLDKAPMDKFSDENVWQDENLTNLFLNGIYRAMPCEYDRNGSWLTGCITDEAESSRSFHGSHQVNSLQYDKSTEIYYSLFSSSSIRKCNLLMEKVQAGSYDDDLKTKLIAQAQFLRAYINMSTYFTYGRFPIIKETLGLEDELAIPRGSEEACIEFIVKDLDNAAAVLPKEWPAAETGRATQGACFALKARFLLNVRDYEGAAKACEEVFKLGYGLFPDFASMFNPENDNNQEVIFDKQFGSDQGGQDHSLDSYENSTYFTGFSSGITCPTQNLVDAFEMIDGKKWNESPLYNPEKPYENKDPRFYSTVLHDGITWHGVKVDMKKGSLFNSSRRASPTGYYLRKFLNPNYDFENSTNNSNYQNSVIIRLADVYLIYAECQFKLNEKGIAREYVNKVRRRVNMPEVEEGDFTFESIMHERRVELALEGQRWNDARRWQKGSEIIGASIYAIVIEDEGDTRTYTRIKVEDRKWEDKMYWFPIHLSEIEKYPPGVLEQNPGW